jgi:hypothetical protein
MNDKQQPLVVFGQAKRLKALGFDLGTISHYHETGQLFEYYFNSAIQNHNAHEDRFTAPTVALALKWVRDVKGVFGTVMLNSHSIYFHWKLFVNKTNKYKLSTDEYATYEAAESALLDAVLDELEKQKEGEE